MENSPTPPPLPPMPQTPPPARGKGNSCLTLTLIGLVALVVLAILAAIAVPTYNRIQERAKELASKNRKKQNDELAVPLTSAEKTQAEAFVSRLIDAVETQDMESLNAVVDYTELADEVFDELSLPAAAKKGFIEGLKKTPGGLFSNILGHKGHLVRHHTRSGIPAVTLRFIGDGSGASYIDLLLKRDGEGGFKCFDLYNYLFGTRVSAESRRAVAMLMKSDGSTLSKILGIQLGPDQSVLKEFQSITASFQGGDAGAVIQKYDALPPTLQRQPFLYAMYVQALQQAGDGNSDLDEKYIKALGRARGVLGEDVTIDLLLVDMHFLKGDMQAARADIEASLRTLGDDSYLYHLLGLMCVRTSDLAGAETALAKAEKIQPDLIDLIDLRLMVLALKKDYTGLVKTMNDFAASTGAELTTEMLSEAVYDDFKKSPEFSEWAAGLKDNKSKSQ